MYLIQTWMICKKMHHCKPFTIFKEARRTYLTWKGSSSAQILTFCIQKRCRRLLRTTVLLWTGLNWWTLISSIRARLMMTYVCLSTMVAKQSTLTVKWIPSSKSLSLVQKSLSSLAHFPSYFTFFQSTHLSLLLCQWWKKAQAAKWARSFISLIKKNQM